MKREELIQKLKELQLSMLSAAVLTLLLKYFSTIPSIGSTKTSRKTIRMFEKLIQLWMKLISNIEIVSEVFGGEESTDITSHIFYSIWKIKRQELTERCLIRGLNNSDRNKYVISINLVDVFTQYSKHVQTFHYYWYSRQHNTSLNSVFG